MVVVWIYLVKVPRWVITTDTPLDSFAASSFLIYRRFVPRKRNTGMNKRNLSKGYLIAIVCASC